MVRDDASCAACLVSTVLLGKGSRSRWPAAADDVESSCLSVWRKDVGREPAGGVVPVAAATGRLDASDMRIEDGLVVGTTTST